MSKTILLLLAVGFIGGCAAQRPASPPQPQARVFSDSPAASLAFTPPLARYSPAVDLPRDERQPGIFVGFDTFTETYSYVRQDDRFTDDTSTRFIRQSVTQRIGHSSR